MDLLRYLLLGDHHNRMNYLAEHSSKFNQELRLSEGVGKGSRLTRKLGAFAKKKAEKLHSHVSKKT